MTKTVLPIDRVTIHRGLRIPTFLYGTAWKEDQTEDLTRLAVESGFLGIDTANQRRHYHEAGVGEALKLLFEQGKVERRELFLQSKFTYASSQDHRIPYDAKADYAGQVEQSLRSSLAHLHVDYLDSYLLHGPYSRRGLGQADAEVWRSMEKWQGKGLIKLLGVSNVDLEQLEALFELAQVKPAFVQNRCYANTGWDADVRRFCRQHGLLYQGFSLLTANERVLNRPEVYDIIARHGCTLAQVVFRFALQVGMMPLTGTSNESHMRQDLASYDFMLAPADIDTIERIAL